MLIHNKCIASGNGSSSSSKSGSDSNSSSKSESSASSHSESDDETIANMGSLKPRQSLPRQAKLKEPYFSNFQRTRAITKMTANWQEELEPSKLAITCKTDHKHTFEWCLYKHLPSTAQKEMCNEGKLKCYICGNKIRKLIIQCRKAKSFGNPILSANGFVTTESSDESDDIEITPNHCDIDVFCGYCGGPTATRDDFLNEFPIKID